MIYFGICDYNEVFFLDDGEELSEWQPAVIGGPVFDPLFDLSNADA